MERPGYSLQQLRGAWCAGRDTGEVKAAKRYWRKEDLGRCKDCVFWHHKDNRWGTCSCALFAHLVMGWADEVHENFGCRWVLAR